MADVLDEPLHAALGLGDDGVEVRRREQLAVSPERVRLLAVHLDTGGLGRLGDELGQGRVEGLVA